MDGVFEPRARLSQRLRNGLFLGSVPEFGLRGGLGAVSCELRRESERLVHELGRLHQPVGETELVCAAPVEHAVLAQRVLDDELDGGSRSDQARHELGAAPARNDSEQALRAGEMAERRRDRACVTVERELDAAAEAGAVDRGDGRIRQRSDTSEELVAGAASLARGLSRRPPRKLVDVGASGEEVRLARDHERGPVVGFEFVEDPRERLERGPAEDGWPRVVGVVVDRDQRHRPVHLRPDHPRELEPG